MIAEYFASRLKFSLVNVEENCNYSFKNLVLVFPVYCQNLPIVVEKFLKKVDVENLSIFHNLFVSNNKNALLNRKIRNRRGNKMIYLLSENKALSA